MARKVIVSNTEYIMFYSPFPQRAWNLSDNATNWRRSWRALARYSIKALKSDAKHGNNYQKTVSIKLQTFKLRILKKENKINNIANYFPILKI